jgi:hypothetical protein
MFIEAQNTIEAQEQITALSEQEPPSLQSVYYLCSVLQDIVEQAGATQTTMHTFQHSGHNIPDETRTAVMAHYTDIHRTLVNNLVQVDALLSQHISALVAPLSGASIHS